MLGNLPRQASNCLGYTSRRHFLGVTAAFAAVPAIAEATESSATLRQVRRIAHIDGPLYYETMGGSGPVMAFIHPNPMDQSCWLYQMAHLSRSEEHTSELQSLMRISYAVFCLKKKKKKYKK